MLVKTSTSMFRGNAKKPFLASWGQFAVTVAPKGGGPIHLGLARALCDLGCAILDLGADGNLEKARCALLRAASIGECFVQRCVMAFIVFNGVYRPLIPGNGLWCNSHKVNGM